MKNWQVRLIAGGLLLLLFALLAFGSRQNAITADEPAYIAGGYALLSQGGEALPLLAQRGYPPLLAGVEALPLYLAAPEAPVTQLAGWPENYEAFTLAFKPFLAPLERTETATRLPAILLTLLLGALVFRWGAELWGPKAGLLALAALVLDPTLLAHGRLAHTDAGATVLGTAALYAAWRWARTPAWRWALATGALLGLTLLAKVSGLLWAAAAAVVIASGLIGRRQGDGVSRLWMQAIVAGGLGPLLLWAGYGFSWGPVSGLPISAPAPDYWQSLLYLRQYASEVFALGRRQYGRWWWYFPLAFLIKNPLPLLAGWTMGLVVLLRRPRSGLRLLALGLFPLLYAGVAIFDGMNIGYRHMLPIHPFLHLALGGGLAYWGWGRSGQPWRRWLLGLLALWCAVGALRVFPYEIAYFNELVGGAQQGYRYLVDSNLDWGQTDRVRAAYLKAHPRVQARPPAAKLRPPGGRYLVGASHLQGVGIGDPDAYEWFRHREPQNVLSYSLLAYDAPSATVGWLAQCAVPAAPLDEAAVAQGLGRDGLRQATFDCTQAWLYPGGKAELGIYALHHDLFDRAAFCPPSLLPCPLTAIDPFLSRHLAQSRLSFEQALDGRLPAFVLFELTSPPATPLFNAPAFAVPAGTAPAALQSAPPASSPITLDGPLTFLGAATQRQGQSLEVETWWRVSAGPSERPFSIMGHLLSPAGQTLAVVDGLGVSPLALAAGDVIVQRHRFTAPPQQAQVWLRTGAYWLDTLARWPVEGAADADVILTVLFPE